MKRGLFFYFGLLLLIGFGFVLTCMVIMWFSPGTNVLGFQYFSNSTKEILLETTDSSHTALDLTTYGKYDEIQISTGYARVRVENGNAFDKSGIVVINNSKGFVKTADAVKFNYTVEVETTNENEIEYNKLKISVVEPKASLYFSNDVQVVVHIADEDANPFGDTKFNISTDSGSIAFGGNASSAYTKSLNIGSVRIQTKSGHASFNEKINYDEESQTQTFTDFNANIGNGSLGFAAPNFQTIGLLTLTSENGNFDFNNVKTLATAKLTTVNGTIRCNKFDANLDIECKNGFFYFNEINGNLRMPTGEALMDNAYIEIGTINGNFTVYNGEKSKIKVNKITGDCDISNTAGSIDVGAEGGIAGSAVLKTKSGSIKACLSNLNLKAKEIITESGSIDLNLDGQVLGKTLVKTKTGNVNINFNIGKSYTFYFANYSNNDEFKTNRVSLKDFDISADLLKSPFEYNPNALLKGSVEIFTDRNIVLGLKK